MPLGAQASIKARTIESLPGSHPAAVIDTELCFLAIASSRLRKSAICVWMSKLSTVLIPKDKALIAKSSTLRVGVHRIATATSWRFSMPSTTGYSFNSSGTLFASRRTIPAISKSGAACKASRTYLPILPYPTIAALIFFILLSVYIFILKYATKTLTKIDIFFIVRNNLGFTVLVLINFFISWGWISTFAFCILIRKQGVFDLFI